MRFVYVAPKYHSKNVVLRKSFLATNNVYKNRSIVPNLTSI